MKILVSRSITLNNITLYSAFFKFPSVGKGLNLNSNNFKCNSYNDQFSLLKHDFFLFVNIGIDYIIHI